jgi:hypothetical protein
VSTPMAEHSITPTGEQGLASAQPRLLIVEDELIVACGMGETARELGWKVCATVTCPYHLSHPRVLMMKSEEEGNGHDRSNPLHRPA